MAATSGETRRLSGPDTTLGRMSERSEIFTRLAPVLNVSDLAAERVFGLFPVRDHARLKAARMPLPNVPRRYSDRHTVQG